MKDDLIVGCELSTNVTKVKGKSYQYDPDEKQSVEDQDYEHRHLQKSMVLT